MKFAEQSVHSKELNYSQFHRTSWRIFQLAVVSLQQLKITCRDRFLNVLKAASNAYHSYISLVRKLTQKHVYTGKTLEEKHTVLFKIFIVKNLDANEEIIHEGRNK